MASAAQAKEPIYSVAGSTAFGSANVDSTNVGNYTLTAGTIVITCTVAKTEPGATIKEKGDKTTAVMCKDVLKEELEGFVNFPTPRIETYKTECNAGAATGVIPLGAFGKAAVFQGKSTVKLSGGNKWGILPK